MTLTLETERCRLRMTSLEDIPFVFSATRYTGFNDGMLWDPPLTEAELEEPWHKAVKSWNEDQAYIFTSENRVTREPIGRIGLRSTDRETVWDIGFWTHPELQGRGYTTEAVARILQFGFDEVCATEIEACYATWNLASKRVLEKNGFSFKKHIPKAFKKMGKDIDEILMGISAENWKALNAS